MSSNHAKVKSNKWASDDDAGSLLAGILDETETAAQDEHLRLEEEMRARHEQQRLHKEELERQRAAEAEQRLHAEQHRQDELKQRRTARMEAIRIEDLKEKGEWIDPAVEEAKRAREAADREEAERARDQELQRQQMQLQMQQMAQPASPAAALVPPQKSSNKGALLALAAVLFLVVGAGAALAALMTQRYEPDPTDYVKTELKPIESKDIVTVVGSTPLPKPEPVVVAEVEEEPKTKRRTKPRRSSSNKDKKKDKKPKKKNLFSDDDLFGGGF